VPLGVARGRGSGASGTVGVLGTSLGAVAVTVVDEVPARFREDLARVRLDIGSKEMTRGFGTSTGAMSTVSVKYTLVSHEVAGDMVVGRVNVAVSM